MVPGSRTFKIIDLGAATDLRVGINYIPKEFLLDPRYLQMTLNLLNCSKFVFYVQNQFLNEHFLFLFIYFQNPPLKRWHEILIYSFP